MIRQHSQHQQFLDTESDMIIKRRDDDIAEKVFRVVDWKYVMGGVVVVVLWAISQWVNYNALLKETQDQSKLIVTLTTEIKGISEQLNKTQTENLKQDFEITRLKDQVQNLVSWKESQANLNLQKSK